MAILAHAPAAVLPLGSPQNSNQQNLKNQTKNAEKPPIQAVFLRKMVRVTGFEPAASCSQSRRATNCATPGYEVVGGLGVFSQMCVGTFSRHSSVLFGPFLCLGSSSLTLFCPACFKKPFRLLGFVWDWILCIKRCSARFEGEMTDQSPQRSGAGIAPHKQRIKLL